MAHQSINTRVFSASAFSIAVSLGFTPALIYEKRRKSWKLNNTEVVLDELPFGRFMEIEGTAESIETVEALLSLKSSEVVDETYPALTARYGTNVDGVIEARFTKIT